MTQYAVEVLLNDPNQPLINGDPVSFAPGRDPLVASLDYIAQSLAIPMRNDVPVIIVTELGAQGYTVHADGSHDSEQEGGLQAEPSGTELQVPDAGELQTPATSPNDGHFDAEPEEIGEDHNTTSPEASGSATIPNGILPDEEQPVSVERLPTAPDATAEVESRAMGTFLELAPHSPASQAEPLGWWKRLMAALGLSKPQLPASPSPEEVELERDRWWVASQFDRPMVVTCANGKGGVGKSPTSQQIAAQFGLAGAGPVLLLELNLFRGTASWETESEDHQSTLEDLLSDIALFDRLNTRIADLDAYVHHQREDRFDVITTDPLRISSQQTISPDELTHLFRILQRWYRVIVVDTGNDEGSSIWRTIAEHTDVLVPVTDTRIKSAEGARLMLQLLTDWGDHFKSLADDAVVVINDANGRRSATILAENFLDSCSTAVIIPFDDALHDSDDIVLRSRNLEEVTRRSYLAAAAMVARGFKQDPSASDHRIHDFRESKL